MRKRILSALVASFISLNACAATHGLNKTRALASAEIPKCWKIYDSSLYDGLYHITIPANDTFTAKDVETMIFSLQAFGVVSHSVTAVGGTSILLEAQFWTLDQAKNAGYPTQDKLEGLVEYVLQNDLPFLTKGVTITCFKEHKIVPHS